MPTAIQQQGHCRLRPSKNKGRVTAQRKDLRLRYVHWIVEERSCKYCYLLLTSSQNKDYINCLHSLPCFDKNILSFIYKFLSTRCVAGNVWGAGGAAQRRTRAPSRRSVPVSWQTVTGQTDWYKVSCQVVMWARKGAIFTNFCFSK